jgi:hypothetical protein
MKNIFSTVNWDIKQYAIATFLGVVDRTAWNQVLKNDERVFKKLDKNYALRHHIIVVSRKFNSMKKRLDYAEEDLDESGFIVDKAALRKAEKALLDICKFCKTPEFEFLAKYSSVAGRAVKQGLEFYCDFASPTPLYEFISMTHSQYLAGTVTVAFDYIGSIKLVRDTQGIKEHARMLLKMGN